MGGVSSTADPNSSNSTLPSPSQQEEEAGPCGERFTAWEQCMKESEKSKESAAAKCIEVFKTLDKCMKEHQDYYDLYLKAELAKEEASKRELRAQNQFNWGFY